MLHATLPPPYWTEYYRRGHRDYSPGETPFFANTLFTGAAVVTPINPFANFDTGPGANKLIEVVEGDVDDGLKTPTTPFWSMPQTVWSLVKPRAILAGGPGCFGIELGSIFTLPPFANPALVRNAIRLFARFSPGGNDWRLLVNNPTTPAQTTTVLAGVNAPALVSTFNIGIVYQPGQFVRAYVDGVIGAEVSAVLPDPVKAERFYAGILCYTEAAASQVNADFGFLRAQTIGRP